MKLFGNGINLDISIEEIGYFFNNDPETYQYFANLMRVALLAMVDKYPPIEVKDETTKRERKHS